MLLFFFSSLLNIKLHNKFTHGDYRFSQLFFLPIYKIFDVENICMKKKCEDTYFQSYGKNSSKNLKNWSTLNTVPISAIRFFFFLI